MDNGLNFDFDWCGDGLMNVPFDRSREGLQHPVQPQQHAQPRPLPLTVDGQQSACSIPPVVPNPPTGVSQDIFTLPTNGLANQFTSSNNPTSGLLQQAGPIQPDPVHSLGVSDGHDVGYFGRQRVAEGNEVPRPGWSNARAIDPFSNSSNSRSLFSHSLDFRREFVPTHYPPHQFLNADATHPIAHPLAPANAQDHRFTNPVRTQPDLASLAQRVYDQLASRVGGVVDVVAERQQKMDGFMKKIAEQQMSSNLIVNNVVAQQEQLSGDLKCVIERQKKSDIAVNSLVEKQSTMVENQVKSEGVLQSILERQSDVIRALTNLRGAEALPTRPVINDPVYPMCMGREVPNSSTPHAHEVSTRVTQMPTGVASKSMDRPVVEVRLIDDWHDGTLTCTFTIAEVLSVSKELKMTEAFFTHWAWNNPGGLRGTRTGNVNSTIPEHGKLSRRVCLGVLRCVDAVCLWTDKPHIRKESLETQKTQHCHCRKRVKYESCLVWHEFRRFSDGVLFRSHGTHEHAKPPPIHLTQSEQEQLKRLTKINPKATPSEFVCGVPGPDGEYMTVMDISVILVNRDRLLYEIEKERKQKAKDGGFFERYSEFVRDHPDFVVDATIGEVVVISVQTDFMATQLLTSMREPKHSEPVNGAVSDAAHKYFSQVNAVLMATTIFCALLRCWMPVLMSYMNGQTAAHYECHFLTYFRIVYKIAVSMNIPFYEFLLLMVMDFSEAERQGFINAFIRFFSELSTDNRSPEDLRTAADKLIKGCLQHFNAQVTRICKTKALVPHGRENEFVGLMQNVESAPTVSEFEVKTDAVLKDFPAVYSWLEWWKRPNVARMIFPAHRVMDQEMWDSIPDTSNAEESFHFALYTAVGKGHDVISGLEGLFRFANGLKAYYNARLCGLRIKYGVDEPWKVFADMYGHTHPSRTKEAIERRRRAVNDGRPPDRVRKLLVRRVLPTSIEDLRSLLKARRSMDLASYRNKDNSCWLDTSFEMLYRVVQRDPDAFEGRLNGVLPGSVIDSLRGVMLSCLNELEGEISATYALTTNDMARDSFRKALLDQKIVLSLTDQDSLFLWLAQACTRKVKGEGELTYAAETYFVAHEVHIRYCAGDDSKPHMQLSKEPLQKRIIDLTKEAHTRFSGRVVAFVKDLFRVRRDASLVHSCWRGKNLCKSSHTGAGLRLYNVLVSYPICLRLHVPPVVRIRPNQGSDTGTAIDLEQTPVTEEPIWDFPFVIELPGIDGNGKRTTCHYDAVARAIHSAKQSHFYAYVSDNLKKCYVYDDTKDGLLVPTASGMNVKNTISGRHRPSDTERTAVVMYHLREGVQGQEYLSRWTQSELFDVHRIMTNIPIDPGTAPTFAANNPSWSEMNSEAMSTWKVSSRMEPDTREYEFMGPNWSSAFTHLDRQAAEDDVGEERPRKRVRLTKQSADSDSDSVQSRAKSRSAASSPTKTPSSRRKKNDDGSSPLKKALSRAKSRSVTSSPMKSPMPRKRQKVDGSSPLKSALKTPKNRPPKIPDPFPSLKECTEKPSSKGPECNFTMCPVPDTDLDVADNIFKPHNVTDAPSTTPIRMEEVDMKEGTLPDPREEDPQKRDLPAVKRTTRSSSRRQAKDTTLPAPHSNVNNFPAPKRLTVKRVRISVEHNPTEEQSTLTQVSETIVKKRGRPAKPKRVTSAAGSFPRPKTSSNAEGQPTHSGSKTMKTRQTNVRVDNITQKDVSAPKKEMRPEQPECDMKRSIPDRNPSGVEGKSADEDEDAEGSTDKEGTSGHLVGKQPAEDTNFTTNVDTPSIATQAQHTATTTNMKGVERKRGREKVDADDDSYEIHCHCGVFESRRHQDDNDLEQDLIECRGCHYWSHQACQHRGFVAFLRPKDHFFCKICKPNNQINKWVSNFLDKELKGVLNVDKQLR